MNTTQQTFSINSFPVENFYSSWMFNNNAIDWIGFIFDRDLNTLVTADIVNYNGETDHKIWHFWRNVRARTASSVKDKTHVYKSTYNLALALLSAVKDSFGQPRLLAIVTDIKDNNTKLYENYHSIATVTLFKINWTKFEYLTTGHNIYTDSSQFGNLNIQDILKYTL